MLDGELDQELVVVMQGLQQAENMIRAGLERARYNVLQRTQRRGREAEAAYVEVRDGTVFASTYDGAVEVPPPPFPAPLARGAEAARRGGGVDSAGRATGRRRRGAERVGGRWRCWRGWARRCTLTTRTGRCSSWGSRRRPSRRSTL